MRKSLSVAWVLVLLSSFEIFATGQTILDVEASLYTFTDKIIVSWIPTDGSLYFQVWRRESIAGGDYAAISLWTHDTSFDDTTAEPGVYYDYKVLSASMSDGSDASESPPHGVGLRTLLAPTDVQASDGTAGYVDLTWTKPAGRANFMIYRSILPSGAPMISLGNTSTTSFRDVTDIQPWRKYYYFVKAVPEGAGYDFFPENNSSLSSPDDGWRIVPQQDLSQTQFDPVRLSWTDLQLMCRLLRGTTQNINDAKPLTNWAQFSDFTDTTVQRCIDYYYFLKTALHEQDSTVIGQSAISEPLHVFQKLRAVVVSASNGKFNNKIAVTWNLVVGAAAYKVYSSATPNFSDAKVVSGWITGTSYDDQVLTNSPYYYWVKAATAGDDNLDEKYTSMSAPDSGNALLGLNYPPSFSVNTSAVTGAAHVSWSTFGLAAKYKVYRNTSADRTTATALTDWIAADQYDDETAHPNVSYYYFVACSYTALIDDGRYITWANAPKAVKISLGTFTITASKEISTHYVAVSWPDLPHATYYMVFRSDVVNAQQMIPITGWFGGTTTFYDSTAAPGAPLNYGVQAANLDVALIAQSSTDVGIKKIERPVISVTKNGGADKITWNMVDGANYYKVYRALGASDTTTMEVVHDWAITDEYLTSDVQNKLYFYFVRAARNFMGDSPSFLSKGVSHNSSVITGLDDDINEITIYPNPSRGMVNLQAPSSIENLSIIDMSGRTLKVDVDNNHVDISGLAAGLYVIHGKCGDRPFAVKIIRSAD